MNTKLSSSCALLWVLGFAGMWVSKGVFDLGQGALPFDLATWIWAVGGLTYCLLGALSFLGDEGKEEGIRG